MRNLRVKLALAVAVVAALAVGAVASATGGRPIHETLVGYQEVPAVSTTASGEFRATLSRGATEIPFELRYSRLEGDVTQAHIHLGQRDVNGGVSAFLCSNLPDAPAGTPACPPSPGTITGTITAASVVGPAAQGIAPGEFDELVRAIRAGVTYVNVHSTKFPGGEVRGQLRVRRGQE